MISPFLASICGLVFFVMAYQELFNSPFAVAFGCALAMISIGNPIFKGGCGIGVVAGIVVGIYKYALVALSAIG